MYVRTINHIFTLWTRPPENPLSCLHTTVSSCRYKPDGADEHLALPRGCNAARTPPQIIRHSWHNQKPLTTGASCSRSARIHYCHLGRETVSVGVWRGGGRCCVPFPLRAVSLWPHCGIFYFFNTIWTSLRKPLVSRALYEEKNCTQFRTAPSSVLLFVFIRATYLFSQLFFFLNHHLEIIFLRLQLFTLSCAWLWRRHSGCFWPPINVKCLDLFLFFSHFSLCIIVVC